MHQVSKPRALNQSMTDEPGRPGTFRSKVGCEAMDEPCTKSTVPRFCALAAGGFFQRDNRTASFPLPPFVSHWSLPDSATSAAGATFFTPTPPQKPGVLH